MTSWSTITLQIDQSRTKYDKQVYPPTGLEIDSGVDEQGWLDDTLYYAVSFGRYQNLRFEKHLEKMHSPRFSGITRAIVCEANDTDDTVEATVFRPNQTNHECRKDGYQFFSKEKGALYPKEKKYQFKDYMEDIYGFAPLIEPFSTVPPDMVFTKSE